jgi:hypothetical protein
MKEFKLIITGVVAVVMLWTLSSCEQDIAVESSVNEDGSVDRTIVFLKADSVREVKNLFGITAEAGWQVNVIPTQKPESADEKKKKDISFKKHFDSVDEMNQELNSAVDSVFKIKSSFEKKFHWFYTYIRYTDTYIAINRVKDVSVGDYFTEEDFSFIKRLPAEGERFSKADSLYLQKLNEKIYDEFAARAVFELHYKALLKVIPTSEKRWADSLTRNKEKMFRVLKSAPDDKTGSVEFMISLADSVGVPARVIPYEAFTRELDADASFDFMSDASEAKFVHSIKMPWTITESNADSVRGNIVFWHPPVIKFMLNDYTMYAESRQMNYWAVILSATLVVITILAFVRIKRKI